MGKKDKRRAEQDGYAVATDLPVRDEPVPATLKKKKYLKKLSTLQKELVKLQYWVKAQGHKVVMLFEGRDAAGKGGMIKRITEPLNPRGCRVVALGTPSDREKTQWYFQRYINHLPAAGEIVIFDRSWYNRAGIEAVMGFCSRDDHTEFLRSCPEFERMIVRSGILLLKYWFSVSDQEQERRFQERAANPSKRWKLSPMDLASRDKWEDYSRAKDEMFAHTDIKQAPWYTVEADDKTRAHLNCLSHILSMIPYEDATPTPLELPAQARAGLHPASQVGPRHRAGLRLDRDQPAEARVRAPAKKGLTP